MKNWKLVAGILSIVFCVFVAFQSFVAGIGDALIQKGGNSGGAGLIVAICMLAGGIVSIVTRSSDSKKGDIALIVIFGVATLVGLTAQGIFASRDLIIWSAWCLVNAAMAVVSIFMLKKKSGDQF